MMTLMVGRRRASFACGTGLIFFSASVAEDDTEAGGPGAEGQSPH